MLSAIAVACSGSGSPVSEAQRAHAEGGVAEVEKPDAFGRVGRGELQAEAAELALGVQDDDGGVGVADVVEVGAQHGGGLAAALAADEQACRSGGRRGGSARRRWPRAAPAAPGRGAGGGARVPAVSVLMRRSRGAARRARGRRARRGRGGSRAASGCGGWRCGGRARLSCGRSAGRAGARPRRRRSAREARG